MADCVFCSIVAGEAPASIVHRDAAVSAFLDIRPVNPGHLLVVPNQHATHLADLPAATGARMVETAQRLAATLRASGLRCEGVNLLLADGVVAGQEVDHVHLHVVPRFAGDGFGFRFPLHHGAEATRSELDAVAAAIRRAGESPQV
jgi:histidine triad (HIT) family protein